jgi:hypothetical protein
MSLRAEGEAIFSKQIYDCYQEIAHLHLKQVQVSSALWASSQRHDSFISSLSSMLLPLPWLRHTQDGCCRR